jgi:aldehyde:ferredoxin oxidoreductase
MEVWRINTQNQGLVRQQLPSDWENSGGRGLIAKILLDEVPPECDPLGPKNKLIYAPGLLVGLTLSSFDRISVGGKSPLTRGVKESNAGGTTGTSITALGIKTLIIEGQPATNEWSVLHLNIHGAQFDPAGDLIGLGVYESAERLLERYGKSVSLAIIGPGGEQQYRAAGILNLDKDHCPSRINARGGLGALMGSKHIKALVIDPQGGQKPSITNLHEFRRAQKIYTQALMNHPQTATYRDFGTPAITRMTNAFGALPTRNFSSGTFEGLEQISGETFRQMLQDRGDHLLSHACMPGCIIRCSTKFVDQNGEVIVAPLEYETIGLMGSNLGIANLESIARLNWAVNDLGLDSMDIGAALGVAVEAGLMEFGDADKALELIQEMGAGTPLGRILGNGASLAGEVLGVRRIPVVKRQAISAYDPRAIKGSGVTYATSPQGADHTAGHTIRAKVNHLDPAGQAELSRKAQINMAVYDSLGACIFAGFGIGAAFESIRDLINARYGWQVGDDFLQELGKTTLSMEREFNRRAGFTPADDRLPEWMTVEPLPPYNATFDVPDIELDNIFNW